MRLANRYVLFVLAVVILAIGAGIFSAGVVAQEEGWQIVRAEYGFKNRRTDVTDILKDLVGRGGVNGRVAITNQTMGGDPAVGADKSLRIFARRRENNRGGFVEREWDYKEGGFVEVRMFDVRMQEARRDDWDDRPARYGNRDRDDWNGLKIIRAYYGIQGRTVNVTDMLRARVRDGAMSFVVTNNALGGDPAVGADKYLIVIYRYQGQEAATFVREGYTLTIP